MTMKYFVKLVGGEPSGDVVPAGSYTAAEDETWVEVVLPAYPRNGYLNKPGVATLTDGVAHASWVAQEDATHEARARIQATLVRQQRDVRIKDVEWRYARYERNARTGAAQQDDLFTLDAYVQALADVPSQAGFPWDIQWPNYVP